jgi:glycosyltransferase involved in cell wall biosynthesis
VKHPTVVTVVVPCWNRAEYLRPTIDSILGQDYPHIECIVVDAGSQDDTVDILKSYGDRIRWVSEPDEGHANAINKGWQLGSGEVLAWLNADDLWDTPGAAGTAVEFLRDHPDVGVVFGECDLIDKAGCPAGHTRRLEWNLEFAVVECDHIITQPAAFLRRSVVEEVGWLDESFYQKKDHEMWLRMALVSEIAYVPVVLAHERNIRGLSFEVETIARSCAQVTKKFYSLPNVPESLRKKRRRAMSNSYLRGAEYAFVAGPDLNQMIEQLCYAALADPMNSRRVFGQARWMLAHARRKILAQGRAPLR